MEKYIEINKEQREKLTKIFGVCPVVISYAINFSRNSEKDLKIRYAAMQNGGKLLVEKNDWTINDLK